MDCVRLYLSRLPEPQSLEDPSRRGIPVPNGRPQPLVASFGRPRDQGQARLGRVTASMGGAQQLKSQLWLIWRSVPMKDQPAISDDVARRLPLHRQDPRRRPLTLVADVGGNVLERRSAPAIDPPMRRDTRVPLGPQLVKDSSLTDPAMPQNKPIGLPPVQRESWRYTGLCQVRSG